MLARSARILSCLLLTFVMALGFTPYGQENVSLAASTPTPPSAIPFLQFGNPGSESEHGVTTSGTTGIDVVHTQVGAVTKDYRVRYMEGAGSSISFQVHGVKPGQNLTLEIEEIHNRQAEPFAYEVWVNNKEEYFRTYGELSAGPNHFFVHVPASDVGTRPSVQVTFKNVGIARVNFYRVWAYSDFQALLAQQHVYRPMGLGLAIPPLTFTNFQQDLATINRIKSEYGHYEMYNLRFAYEIYYMKTSMAKVKDQIAYILKLSHATGVPVSLDLTAWWAGTPTGPDGRGNTWGNVKYQQIVYDPLNVDGMGNYQLTTPNIWSNTPWLSMNDRHYNDVRAAKIRELVRYISMKSAEMAAAGQSVPPINVIGEVETVYWPYFSYYPSPMGSGDFSPLVKKAALADGVTLDPAKGLTQQDRMWLEKNLTNYYATVADAIQKGAGYNPIVIDNGTIQYPNYQLADNAYSHTFVDWGFPINNSQMGNWETQIFNNIHFGGEAAGGGYHRYYNYLAARGKYAIVNIARGSITNFHVLPRYYADGAEFATIYNPLWNSDYSLIAQYDHLESQPYIVPSYSTPLYQYDFN